MIKMKNKKTIIIISVVIILLVIIGIISFIILSNKNDEENAKQTFTQYIGLINDDKYEEMYNYLTTEAKGKISEEDFLARNKNIYEGIDAENIKIEIQSVEKQGNIYKISYNEKMYTSAGEINFSNVANIEKIDKEYKINWNSTYIFPQLTDTDKVRVSTIKAKRGSILDRNEKALAEDGKIAQVGIVPGKLGENKDSSISQISNLLGISTDFINEQLSADYVKDDTFVPIKKISDSNTELKEQLLQISGILINKVDGRVYSLGKEAGHLIGYVQAINSEELEANQGKGYNTNSLIGKSGLEKAYEDKLKGTDGSEIYIEDENGNRVRDIAIQEKKDGQNVKLTIDSNIQSKIYEQMKNDKGFFVVMEPKTGELLALVSTPTFDSNDFVTGLTTEQWNALNNDESKPLYNRFLQSYCPGSTFKPITGAIGITTGKIDPNEDLGYTGTSWQKDSSWGDYEVTTLTGYNGPKNLVNAIMHSDNIYFAQVALKMGTNTFTENLDKIGFNEQLEFPLTLAKSSYGEIETEGKLADTGFGQGNLQVNPIHMASIYSSFANNGSMIKPYIEYGEDTEILKRNVFTEESANTIKNALIQVVENKEGSANDMKIQGTTIAGKTGTAELKQSKEDTESGTLGWFDCFTIDRQNGDDMLIVSMVENKQNNAEGGSHYLISKIRTLFE